MKKEELICCHMIDKYIDWNEQFIVVTQKKNETIKVLFVGTLADWIGSSVAYEYEMKPIRSFRQRKDRMSIAEV
jgi:hypothetical protein